MHDTTRRDLLVTILNSLFSSRASVKKKKSFHRIMCTKSLQQLFHYFATFSAETLLLMQGGGQVAAGGWSGGAGVGVGGYRASLQPLLCRIHAVKL